MTSLAQQTASPAPSPIQCSNSLGDGNQFCTKELLPTFGQLINQLFECEGLDISGIEPIGLPNASPRTLHFQSGVSANLKRCAHDSSSFDDLQLKGFRAWWQKQHDMSLDPIHIHLKEDHTARRGPFRGFLWLLKLGIQQFRQRESLQLTPLLRK